MCRISKGTSALILGIKHYRLVKIHDGLGKLTIFVVNGTTIEIGTGIVRIEMLVALLKSSMALAYNYGLA